MLVNPKSGVVDVGRDRAKLLQQQIAERATTQTDRLGVPVPTMSRAVELCMCG